MNIKSFIKAGDLFISYWYEKQLTIIAGDNNGILSTEQVPVKDLSDLISLFEKNVNQINFLVNFIAEDRRSSKWPIPQSFPIAFDTLTQKISEIIITPKIKNYAVQKQYNRLILFPDRQLNALPIHLFLNSIPGFLWYEKFSEGIIYAPSGSSYAYACSKKQLLKPYSGLILVGDEDDDYIKKEAELVASYFPFHVDIISKLCDFKEYANKADLLYIATHGQSFDKNEGTFENKLETSQWKLLFDRSYLDSKIFYNGQIKLKQGARVILSACNLGRLAVGPLHELNGLAQAIFYSGAATIVAARWPVINETAEAIFCETIQNIFNNELSIAAAMNNAIRDAYNNKIIKEFMYNSTSIPFFFGPFVLFGCGD